MLKFGGKYSKFDIIEFPKAFPASWCKKAIDLYRKYEDLAFKPIVEYGPAAEYRQGSLIDIDLYPDNAELAALVDRYRKLVTEVNKVLQQEYKAIERSTILVGGLQLIKYLPGETVLEHADGLYDASLEPSSSFATMVVYLNKPKKGGGTYFKRQKAVVEPEVGKCLIFPPYHTHIHGMIPATSDRYVLTTWLHLKHSVPNS